MLPAIPPGAVLSIEVGNFEEQKPRPGELIAFRRGNQIVCHRFYGTLRIGWRRYGIEKGDANRVAGLFRVDTYLGCLEKVGEQAGQAFYQPVIRPPLPRLLIGLIRERLQRRRCSKR